MYLLDTLSEQWCSEAKLFLQIHTLIRFFFPREIERLRVLLFLVTLSSCRLHIDRIHRYMNIYLPRFHSNRTVLRDCVFKSTLCYLSLLLNVSTSSSCQIKGFEIALCTSDCDLYIFFSLRSIHLAKFVPLCNSRSCRLFVRSAFRTNTRA